MDLRYLQADKGFRLLLFAKFLRNRLNSIICIINFPKVRIISANGQSKTRMQFLLPAYIKTRHQAFKIRRKAKKNFSYYIGMRFDSDKTFQLAIGILGIYGIYFLVGLLQEAVIKLSYANDETGHMESFDYPQAQVLIGGTVTFLIGSIYNLLNYSREERNCVPMRHGLKCGAAVTSSTIAYSYAIYLTNFPVVMMIRSCSILSVVLVGVLFTGVEDLQLKLGRRKIFIAAIATVGIIVFKMFDGNDQKGQKQTAILGIVLMIVSLMADGFLPDFQAVIKSKYKPLPTVLMTEVNKWSAILAFIFSISTGHFVPMFSFIFAHTSLMIDLIAIGVLSTLGQLFVYRLIKQFKQHIVPFIITTRKIFTVGLSILYYKHTIAEMQLIGLVIVFGISIYEFYCEIKKDNQDSSKNGSKISETTAAESKVE